MSVVDLKARLAALCRLPPACLALFRRGLLCDTALLTGGDGDTILLLRRAGLQLEEGGGGECAEGGGRGERRLSGPVVLSVHKVLGMCWKTQHVHGMQLEAASVARASLSRSCARALPSAPSAPHRPLTPLLAHSLSRACAPSLVHLSPYAYSRSMHREAATVAPATTPTPCALVLRF